MRPVRISAKAIIIQDGKLLTLHKMGEEVEYYALPGGGQNGGETLPEALRRECMEELSLEVEVGQIVYIRDYISANHEFARFNSESHILNIVFACRILSGVPQPGSVPDSRQVGIEWLPIDDLPNLPFFPQQGIPSIRRWWLEGKPADPIYLGDNN
jgi:8-oxo-dGTP diphosphatase